MQVLHDRFADDPSVNILAIHFDDRSDATAYFDKHGYSYPYVPRGAAVARAFEVTAIPTFLVVDPSGRIIHRHVGRLTDRQRDQIEKVAREAASEES